MTQAPTGWYPQPDGTQRYWDGSAWTEHIAPGFATEAAVAAAPVPAAPVPATPLPATTVQAAPAPVALTPAAPAVAETFAVAVPPAPTFATPGTEKKSRVPLILGIVGGVLALIVVAVVILVMFVFKATAGPRDTVNDFVTAANSNDCEGMIAVVTQRYKDDNYFDSCESFEPSEESNIKYNIDGVTTSGDTSTVAGTLRDITLDETYDLDFGLVKEDGKWKIDELRAG